VPKKNRRYFFLSAASARLKPLKERGGRTILSPARMESVPFPKPEESKPHAIAEQAPELPQVAK
jgi:hypothetical protein